MKNESNSAVLVLGGPGSERFVSMATGTNVLRNCDFSAAIFVSESGACYRANIDHLKKSEINFADYPQFDKELICEHFDQLDVSQFGKSPVFFLALHGSFGEDGQLQKILDEKGCAYTGSGFSASKNAFDKPTTKEIAANIGIKVPKTVSIRDLSAYDSNHKPLIIKPKADGSSNGIHKFENARKLIDFLDSLSAPEDYLIEEVVVGQEYTCGVYETSSQKAKALEPVEISHDSAIFGFDEKYKENVAREVCPCDLDKSKKDMIKEAAVKIHQAVGCRGYSRSDFILSGDDVYFLEINTLPGLTPNSLYPKELRAEGIKISDFIGEQILLARHFHKS